MLESLTHSDNAFVTLTYAEDQVPVGGSLIPRHLQLFLKRLRNEVYPSKIRYFGCGEYGDKTERPHYHLALFGYPGCVHGRSRYVTARGLRASCCSTCDVLLRSWEKGVIFSGSLTAEAAAYVSGYVTKKMTGKDDARLNGRHPEFARMSLRPGIGFNAMTEVARAIVSLNLNDVPSSLRHGTRLMPLGRYLRRKLRERIGRNEEAPPEVLEALKAEMLQLYAQAAEDGSLSTFLPKQALMAAGDGAVAQMQARQKLYSSKRTL